MGRRARRSSRSFDRLQTPHMHLFCFAPYFVASIRRFRILSSYKLCALDNPSCKFENGSLTCFCDLQCFAMLPWGIPGREGRGGLGWESKPFFYTIIELRSVQEPPRDCFRRGRRRWEGERALPTKRTSERTDSTRSTSSEVRQAVGVDPGSLLTLRKAARR